MADVTNYPEMTDELLQKYIARAMQQAMKPEDTGSPLTSGLLAAGLGMMAGSRGRNFGEALGQGGLLGLQAYGAQKEAQKKDPMQMINLLTAVEGLKEQKAGRDWMKSFTPTTGQEPLQFQPAPGMPADVQQRGRGMFDRGGDSLSMELGQMAPPPSVGGYQMPANTPDALNKVWGGIGFKGRPGELAKSMLEVYTKPPNYGSPGQTPMTLNPRTLQWEPGQQIPNLAPGMRPGPGGAAEEIPNYTNIAAKLAAATEQGKTDVGFVQVDDGRGGKEWVTGAEARRRLQPPDATAPAPQPAAPGQPQELPPEVLKMIDDVRKQYGFNVSVNRQGAPAPATAAPPQQPAQFGRVQSKAEEAAAVQAAEQPGLIARDLAQNQNKADIKKVDDAYAKAQSASESNVTIRNLRDLSTGPNAARGGMMAPTLQSVDAFLNGVGIPFNAAQFKSTEEAQTHLAGLTMSQVKAMVGSTNISNQDVAAVRAMMPQIINNPEVRLKLYDIIEKGNDRHIDTFTRMDTHLRDTGNLKDFDYGMTPKQETKAQTAEQPPINLTNIALTAKKYNMTVQQVKDELKRKGVKVPE